MASIPNMRSTPLPAPAPKAPPAENAPGDFAAKMPAVRGQAPQPGAKTAPAPIDLTELVAPDIGEVIEAGEVEGEAAPATKADAPKADEAPAPVFVPVFPGAPVQVTPQEPLAAASVEAPVVQPEIKAAEVAIAGTPGRRACGTGDTGEGGKQGLPGPAFIDLPRDEAATPELDAAVKTLLQRKQVLAKPAGTALAPPTPTDGAKTAAALADSAPVPIATQAPATSQAGAPLPTVDLPQPVLAALDTQPAPVKAAGNADAPRATELPTEKQLDISRDTAWLDRLARDIARAGANDAPLRFRLHPQTLGHLQVELQQGDHGTSVRLTVETEAARGILADAQPRLAAEARAQGVRIAETHVDLSGSGRHAPGDQRRQDETRQNPLIRTVHDAGADGTASARSSDRTRLDRYA